MFTVTEDTNRYLTHSNGQFLVWSGGCPLFVGRMPLNVIFSNLVTSVLKSLQWSLNTVNTHNYICLNCLIFIVNLHPLLSTLTLLFKLDNILHDYFYRLNRMRESIKLRFYLQTFYLYRPKRALPRLLLVLVAPNESLQNFQNFSKRFDRIVVLLIMVY